MENGNSYTLSLMALKILESLFLRRLDLVPGAPFIEGYDRQAFTVLYFFANLTCPPSLSGLLGRGT
jgi:hypothetical protein